VANDEHVAILKQGVEVWNQWRNDYPYLTPDLSNANFSGINLTNANFNNSNLENIFLRNTILNYVDFTNANLIQADLRHTYLVKADLCGSTLNRAYLTRAYVKDAVLIYTNLATCDLTKVDFIDSNLAGANFTDANLMDANLINTIFEDVKFENTLLSRTVFSGINLSNTLGLSSCKHYGPCFVDNQTLKLSGELPEIFLKGIGLADWEIEQVKLYQKDLDSHVASDILYKIHELRFDSPIQIHNLFLSYAHKDSSFVDEIASSIDKKGIRFWRDSKDLPVAPAGPLGKVILKEMKGCIVLLVLSKESVSRPWVRFEIENAAKMEVEEGREVLLPIALDDAWKTYNWPIELADRIKRYNIIDFSDWQDEDIYKQRFEQVLKGLDLFYKNDELS